MAQAPAGGGGNYSYAQLEQLWTQAGGPAHLAPLMAAIALAESHGDPGARNPSGASGLWQILGAPAGWKGSQDWFNPQVNARAAVAKYRTQGLGAWATYTSGAYKKFLHGGGFKAADTVRGGPALVDEASKYVGTPYVWGGDKPGGFDCSGLVQYALQAIGVKNVPRTSEEQWGWVQKIKRSALQPGDLIFEQWPGEQSPGHVAIYAGQGFIIQAPAPGQDVQKVKWSPQIVHAEGGSVVGYGRVPSISKAGYSGATPQGTGGGGLGQWVSSLWSSLFTGYGAETQAEAGALGDVTGISDVAQAVTGLTAPFVKFADAIDWFMQPNHWIRIFCGIGGSLLTVVGIWNLSHAGGQASSVTVMGSNIPTSLGGSMALPFGILEVGLGGIGLFVAFHNLPSDVKTLPDFLSYLQQNVQATTKETTQKAAA